MKPLAFEADVDGQPKPVQMRFGNETDLAELRRWRSPARLRTNPHVSGALEYAGLASKRWAIFSASARRIFVRPTARMAAALTETALPIEFLPELPDPGIEWGFQSR